MFEMRKVGASCIAHSEFKTEQVRRMQERVGNRVKVAIRCKRCGERFVLRGRKERGTYHTGFKMCLCNNADDFEYEVQDHV
jgi:DNA-directed RNA polymerase subunit RPC12/RpoP